MEKNKYNNLKNKGKVGEDFFFSRHNEVLIHPAVIVLDMGDWNVEGSDMAGERLMWEKAWIKDPDGIDREGFSPYFEYGGIETKSLDFDQFLPRFGVDDLACGTLGFPIWSGTKDLPNNRTEYTREAHGNLRRWMEPSVDNRSSKPMIFCCLLKTSDFDMNSNRETERFFASIVFEDVEALLDRITAYLLPYGLDLRNWKGIDVGQKARDLNISGLYLQGNMVQIPLSVIGDLATVTMIGEDPVIYSTGKCRASVQYERLNYLKMLANGRWMPQERPETGVLDDAALQDLWHKKMFLGWPQYQGLLDKEGKLIR